MTSKNKLVWLNRQKPFLPAILLTATLLAVAFFGSLYKQNQKSNSSISFKVTPDQVSESYMLANLSSRLRLVSADALAGHYVTLSVINEAGQSSPERIEKPNIVDTSNLFRGVKIYQVKQGDTLDTIAKQFKLTTTQIRWSNKLKDNNISVGQTLEIPSIPGIIYVVKNNDDIDKIVQKYNTNKKQLIEANDLDVNSLVVGAKIVLPNGVLPEKERPEYVPPRPVQNNYNYTYLGSSYNRKNIRRIGYCSWCGIAGNPGVAGECTWYAWAWRHKYGRPLPSGVLGNANSWAYTLSSYGVNRIPAVGAIFQTASGIYGHVGVVTAVHSDGSITIREMNYGYERFMIKESEVPASHVGSFNYIH